MSPRLPLVPLLCALLLLAGCATSPGRFGKTDTARARYTAPVEPIIGRIAYVNTRQGTAVVALDPAGAGIFRAGGLSFTARRDDLTPTARLTGTDRRLGTHLGVLVTEGTPDIGDEVVLTAPARPPEEK